MTVDWALVAKGLTARANADERLDDGQRRSLRFIAARIPEHGVVLADEVGTGKTRIACVLADVVMAHGGRVATVVPRGLLAQWKEELKQVQTAPRRAQELTSWQETVDGVKDEAGREGWWLLAHGFRFPSIQDRSPAWRFALPWLVLLAAQPDRRTDARTKLYKLWDLVEQRVEDRPRWAGQWRLAQQMKSRLPGELLQRLASLQQPDWEPNAKNEELAELFRRRPRGEGLRVVDDLLKHWIGRVDLLVVDEAHKSRDVEEDQPRTVLSELLEYSLKTDSSSRRLCLTATPMELGMEQWTPLLHRTRAGAETPKIETALQQLQQAVRAATEAPDETKRHEALVTASRRFQGVLRPFLTRRRRRSEELLQHFNARALLPGAQPHRDVQPVPISWNIDVAAAGEHWRDILFALEGISRAARGMSAAELTGGIKTLHTKLATGHIALDLFDKHQLPMVDVGSPDTSAQQLRLHHWCKQYAAARKKQNDDARTREVEGFDPDAEHPRILAAVRTIEAAMHKSSPPEKVLCFGVFLQPLRILRTVLNVRHALRCVDEQRPVTTSFESHPGIIWENYRRMRQEGLFSAALAGVLLTPVGLAKALKKQNQLHRNQRAMLARDINKQIDGYLAGLGIELRRDDRERLHGIMQAVALEARMAGDTEEGWLTEIRRVVETREETTDAGDDDPTRRLMQWIEDEHADGDDGRHSGFCRLLQGSSQWTTRRTLQSAFNRERAFPMVLLAQSQVGREGLNLHLACRNVVQLHPEWNPAILEQQIGRVDRKGGLWERLARRWLDGGAAGEPPRIHVRQLIFEGTYDAKQWSRVGRRQHLFDAALFGNLLPLDAMLRATDEQRIALETAAPDFSPP